MLYRPFRDTKMRRHLRLRQESRHVLSGGAFQMRRDLSKRLPYGDELLLKLV